LAVVLSIVCVSAPSDLTKASNRLPKSAPRPSIEAAVDRRRWTVDRRTVFPAAADFQDMNDAADDTATVETTGPGQLFGSKGSITDHCRSLSQNSFDISKPHRSSA
jgi:hypothetical protein